MSQPVEHSNWRLDALLIGAGAFVLYLLAIGPLARLAQEGIVSDDNRLLQILYWPVGWGMQHSDVVRDAIFAYLYLWGVRLG